MGLIHQPWSFCLGRIQDESVSQAQGTDCKSSGHSLRSFYFTNKLLIPTPKKEHNNKQFKTLIKMSSYIIAGSADSLDTAYCQQIARKIKSKYKNIDFRVVIKHPSQWQEYLNQICRIYGFLKKSNPIIYTYHGKIIGNKDAFVNSTVKYFGLSQESLIVPNLSTAVNIKLANEQLQRKKAQKTNTKTLTQKISQTHDKLLKQGILKHEFKTKNQFLINGIQYYFREVPGLCPPIKFQQNLNLGVEVENIAASNLNLMELSIQDRIVPEDGGKEPFVTNQGQGNNNQVLNTESMERMSQASRTNKLQSSVMSKDEDSKINRQSNKDKQKIDQQFDDVADYTNINMTPTLICQLGDQFCLAFEPKTHIPGQMIFYHNEAQNNGNGNNGGNMVRVYNDRPVIGHHTIVKEIHYIGEPDGELVEANENLVKEANEEESIEASSKKIEEEAKLQEHNPAQKSKTQPNIPQPKNPEKLPKPFIEQQALSQPCSDLHLLSNLNYHTLYILKPLSPLQLKHLLHLLQQTNTIATLQFCPENPNPKIRVYNRGMLLDTCDSLFPVENFINKQVEDGEMETVVLPRDWRENGDTGGKVTAMRVNEIGFHHLCYMHPENINEEDLGKALKLCIDQLLHLQQKLKKQIGYNLIFTKKYTLLVSLTEPYRIYGDSALYFDGLAYLGYVQVARVVEGYKLKEEKMDSGKAVREALGRCSGAEKGE